VSKIGVVTAREFLSTVKRRSYLIVTFGMPLFAALYVGIFAVVPAYFVAKAGAARKPVGIVDLAGIVRMEEERTASRTDFRPLGSRVQALEELGKGTIECFYLIPPDYLDSGAVETYQADDRAFGIGKSRLDRSLRELLNRSLLADRLPQGVRARVEEPVVPGASSTYVLREDGTVEPLEMAARLARLAIPGAFAVLLLMSLMTSAGYLVQGVSEEKESKVIEVILSSVSPDQLLFGKLFGLGAAGLLQLVIWASSASLATSLLAAAALAALDVKLFAFCLLFFILGFLMVGSLLTGTGALGSNARESQQFAAVWTLSIVLPPALTWMVVLDEPNGWLARGLGWFPLTASITMMMRLGTGQVPLWDILVALLCLAAGVYVAIRVSASLFRLGLLMLGKRPTLREIALQIRRA
jgi:ABC-2 type transport system permease protein